MTSVNVSKAALVTILIKNRDDHRASFIEAQKVYRNVVIRELDDMLSAARCGDPVRRHVNFRAPEDHTAEYERLIGLLELATNDSIDLTLVEYNNYVQDNWAWSAGAKALNNAYTSNNINPMFVGEDSRFASSY